MVVLGLAGVCAGVLGTPRTEADFHQVQINQLMAGAFGDDNIEFVEIQIGFRQNCQGVAGLPAKASDAFPLRLRTAPSWSSSMAPASKRGSSFSRTILRMVNPAVQSS